MKVELINHTQFALETLIYTKNTRLQGQMSLDDIISWPFEKKEDEFKYMLDTIQSSLEFVDYTFKISGVTRAFTHQLVRTRTGSYAQEAQRVVDVRDQEVLNTTGDTLFDELSNYILNEYGKMIDSGVSVQDARGILPTNMTTNIICKFNLRTLHDMSLLRLCKRAQGEYQKVFKQIVDSVVAVHPWAERYLKVYCVWYGSCAFPRYTECPMQTNCFKPDREDLQAKFDQIEHEAAPVLVQNGRTM
jgi:thymidylate synthase ThyX